MSTGGSGARVIDGRFELLERLGSGGMGLVWRARDLVLLREVAVKEVRPSDPGLAEHDPQAARLLRERVLREARALARVHHPNVVAIHHVVDGGEGTFPWLVMELVTGGSLQDRLERGPLTAGEAAGLGREVLAALRAAHAVGIEHRDVKPPNVLLRPDGRPVLTDFGIAAIREHTSLTATGAVIGSPDYMAPERVSGKDGGPAADLWSLAMMLYVAVEGHHPLRRSSTLATLAAVLSEEVPPPRQAGPLTPVLSALLVKDPQARPDAGTVDRMLAEAGQAAAGGAPTGPGRAPHAVAPPATTASSPGPAYGSAPPGSGYGSAPHSPGYGPAPHGPAYGPSVPADAAPTSYHLPPPGPGSSPGGPVVTVGVPPVRRPARRARVLAVATSVAGVALAGALVWTLLPDDGTGGTGTGSGGGASTSAGGRTTGTDPGSGRGTAGATGGATPAADDKGTAPADLLTAEGLRTTVAKIKAASGGEKFTSFAVYGEYAIAGVPVKGNPELYDSYRYDAGADVAVKSGPGGTVMSGEVPVDPDIYDWDAVPALLAKAARTLKVPSPTARYIVVQPASTVFDTDPYLGVYLADAYGSGHLSATVGGKVTNTYPRGS
ncbi:serine/threonine-protein kinase [Streptomyces longwoodensis]|uniref:serine/threonine-protein kinase n=1 Tax=Streptomyces longwoodensis TaxID=68231 RepID=UPI00382A8DD2